jgi:hypothetical protein
MVMLPAPGSPSSLSVKHRGVLDRGVALSGFAF